MKKFLKMFRYETSAGFTVALFFMFIVKTLLWIDSINESDAKYYADGLVKFGIVLLVFVIINWTAIQRYVKDEDRKEFFGKMNRYLVLSVIAMFITPIVGIIGFFFGLLGFAFAFVGYIFGFVAMFAYQYTLQK